MIIFDDGPPTQSGKAVRAIDLDRRLAEWPADGSAGLRGVGEDAEPHPPQAASPVTGTSPYQGRGPAARLTMVQERLGPDLPGAAKSGRDAPLRVAVVGRQLLVSQAVAVGLTGLGDMSVTALHPGDRSLAASCRQIGADLVLIVLEDEPSSVVAMLHRALPDSTRLVVMAEIVDLPSVATCIGEGASGYLTAAATIEEVGDALRRIAAGYMVLPWLYSHSHVTVVPEAAVSSAVPAPRVEDAGLTPREREILELLTRGQSTAEIAESLRISINTTRTHVQRLLKKLQVHSRLELTAYAAEQYLKR